MLNAFQRQQEAQSTLMRLSASHGLSAQGLISLGSTQTFKVGRMFSMLAELGDKIPDEEVTKTIFHADRVPRIPVAVYYL